MDPTDSKCHHVPVNSPSNFKDSNWVELLLQWWEHALSEDLCHLCPLWQRICFGLDKKRLTGVSSEDFWFVPDSATEALWPNLRLRFSIFKWCPFCMLLLDSVLFLHSTYHNLHLSEKSLQLFVKYVSPPFNCKFSWLVASRYSSLLFLALKVTVTENPWRS